VAFFLKHSKGFRLGRSGREVLVFLFFLVISGGFWFFTALNQTYEKELSVPVRLTGVPNNIITADMNDTLRVVVRDKGFAFLEYTFGQKIHPLEFSFSTHTGKEGRGTITTQEIQKQLSTVLFASTKVVSVKPERIEFTFDKGISKKVPVRIDGDIVPADKYFLADSQVQPQTVTVYALKSVLDELKYVSTEKVECKDFVDSVEIDAKIKQIQGVKIVPNKVRITLYADVMTEQTLEVPIKIVNVPDSLVVRTFPTKAEVKFTIGASQYHSIQTNQFDVELNYSEIQENTDKCAVHLRNSPSSAKNARLTIGEVDYVVETR